MVRVGASSVTCKVVLSDNVCPEELGTPCRSPGTRSPPSPRICAVGWRSVSRGLLVSTATCCASGDADAAIMEVYGSSIARPWSLGGYTDRPSLRDEGTVVEAPSAISWISASREGFFLLSTRNFHNDGLSRLGAGEGPGRLGPGWGLSLSPRRFG